MQEKLICHFSYAPKSSKTNETSNEKTNRFKQQAENISRKRPELSNFL